MHLELKQMWIVTDRNVIVRRLHVCVWTCIYPFATVGYVIHGKCNAGQYLRNGNKTDGLKV